MESEISFSIGMISVRLSVLNIAVLTLLRYSTLIFSEAISLASRDLVSRDLIFSSVIFPLLSVNSHSQSLPIIYHFFRDKSRYIITSMKTIGYERSVSPILVLETPCKSLQDNNLPEYPRGCNSNVNNNLGQF